MSLSFSEGNAGREAGRAHRRSKDAKFLGGSFTGPGGIGANFDFSGNRATGGASLGSLGPLFEQLLGASGAGLDQAQGGLPEWLTNFINESTNQLGSAGGQNNASDFSGFGDIFQSSSQIAGSDPFELGAGISDKLRQISERKNQRLTANTFDRLKASGMLGTTGGAGIAGELDQNLFNQGLQFDLAGLDAGRSLQQDAFGRAIGASGAREGIAGRNFGEELAKIMGGAGLQSGLFDQQLQNQAQGANIGFGAGQLAGNVSQIPLQFLQALLGAGTTASNSLLGAAGISQQNAQLFERRDEAQNTSRMEIGKMIAQAFGGS